MNATEQTYITDKLIGAIRSAGEIITPEERYELYRGALRMLEILLKLSKPLRMYREDYPSVVFTERTNGLDVYPDGYETASRSEALDWRNLLLAEGLGGLTLFRVFYAAGGFVEYAGESEESKVIGRIMADYGDSWQVFRSNDTGSGTFINLVCRSVMDKDPAQALAESLSATLKERYPYEIIVVRVRLREPVDGKTEVRVVGR